jgi:hypothetical protein
MVRCRLLRHLRLSLDPHEATNFLNAFRHKRTTKSATCERAKVRVKKVRVARFGAGILANSYGDVYGLAHFPGPLSDFGRFG